MTRSVSPSKAMVVAAAAALAIGIWSFNSTSSEAAAATAAAQPPATARQVIIPEGGRPGGLLTPGIMVGNTLYLSGQLGLAGRADGVAGETKASINNALNILKAANMDLTDVVAVTAYLVDIEDYNAFNTAYREMFTEEPRPTRATVIVKDLVSSAKVELTMTAVKTK